MLLRRTAQGLLVLLALLGASSTAVFTASLGTVDRALAADCSSSTQPGVPRTQLGDVNVSLATSPVTVAFGGGGFAPGTVVTVSVNSVPQPAQLRAGSDGQFLSAVLLTGTSTQRLVASGADACGHALRVTQQVSLRAAPVSADAPAGRTASSTVPALLGGLALVVAVSGLSLTRAHRLHRRR